MKNLPFVISCLAHILILFTSYLKVGGLFSEKIKDSGYVVFDFVQIGPKSKAPVLSDKEGKLSKTKAKTKDNDGSLNLENQPEESSSKKETKEKKETVAKESKKKEPEKKAVPVKDKKAQPKKEQSKKEKAKANKTTKTNNSKASEKAIVNLRKNKKGKTKSDPKAATKSFNSLLDSALATSDNENSGIKAEEVGEVLTATQIDLIRQTIRKCWHLPAGLKNAEDLIVDIKMELDESGNVTKAEIVDKNRMASDPDFRIAAENAHRAVLDPKCNPLPLPKEKFDEWKDLELSFNPKDMFE